jgi:hypothetical protein
LDNLKVHHGKAILQPWLDASKDITLAWKNDNHVKFLLSYEAFKSQKAQNLTWLSSCFRSQFEV